MKSPPKAGNHVRVTTPEGTYEGTIIQRPPLLVGEAIVLKLDNGYNIGINPSRAKKIEQLSQPTTNSPLPPSHSSQPLNQKLPTVSILSTGGTISSKIDYATGGVSAHYTAEDFLEMLPELKTIANIQVKKVASMMTEDVTPQDWLVIAKHIQEELKTADGVVVTMGTDMMHYISAAFSYLLQGLNKPVIITGAQRSIDRGSSDAFLNLLCAVKSASQTGLRGVYVCMHETINDTSCVLLHGAKVRKMHTSRRDAFRPVNHSLIARVTVNHFELLTPNPWSEGTELKLQTKLSDDVALIPIYPGMDSDTITNSVKKGARVLILSATALGHVPTNGKGSILPALEHAKKKGALIVITTQTLYGHVNPSVYTNLRKLSIGLGALYLEELTPETAYVKAIITGSRAKTIEQRRTLLTAPLVNEFTIREQPEDYLR